MKAISLLAISLAVGAVGNGCLAEPGVADADKPATAATARRMKIRIKTATTEWTATLDDNATARDFASLLPLDLTLDDYTSWRQVFGN